MLGCWLVTKTHTRDGVDYVSRAADRGVIAPIVGSWLTASVTGCWAGVGGRRVVVWSRQALLAGSPGW